LSFKASKKRVEELSIEEHEKNYMQMKSDQQL
jgi:hypothetical protein